MLLRQWALAVPLFWAFVCPVPAQETGETTPAETPETAISPEERVRALADFYASLDSFSTEYTESMKIETQGMKQAMDTHYFCAVQKPNRFALTHKSGMAGPTQISDGVKMTTYMPNMNQYTVEDAPATLQEIIEPLDMFSGPVSSGVVWKTLLGEKPYDLIMEGVGKSEYVGTVTENGKTLHQIRLLKDKMAADLWILDGDTPWLSKLSFDLSSSMKDMIGDDAAKTAPMSFVIEFIFQQWTEVPQLSDDTFRFYPPDGAKQAESIYDMYGMEDADKGVEHLIGTDAPDFELDDLSGSKVKLSEHFGKQIVVLDFWATWCPPCVKGLPIVSEVTDIYREKGVLFYAVNQQETKEVIEDFLEKEKLDIQVVLDRDGSVGDRYAVTGIPQTVIVGKDGKIKSVHVGLLPNLDKRLGDELESLIADEIQAVDVSTSDSGRQ
ncbi:MAG: hypothetical protein AMXMBFR84_43780 [Candidatus Hydrogenedentota bacterium]